ncbi:hypothetical protein EV426DRAFT_718523 [Tirmania nivea]|nr:hypothetical protein EV426DRAFT_718523 [Tirmania nivea]
MASTLSSPAFTNATGIPEANAPGYRVGVGLIEVSALGAMIGTTSVEALASGNKAAAGLPWASMSMFGSVYCAKAAIACLVPDWSRETLGLTSTFVDASLGLNIAINTKVNAKQRAAAQIASGVWVPYHADSDKQLEAAFTPYPTPSSRDSIPVSSSSFIASSVLSGSIDSYERDRCCRTSFIPTTFFKSWNLGSAFREPHVAYAFDQSTTITLARVMPSEGHEAIQVHPYNRDPTPVRNDWLAIAGSLVKLLEMAVLYHARAKKLWWVTAISWAPAYCSTIILQISGVGRDGSDVGEIDLIAGELPSPIHSGRSGRIILGIPGNIHRSRIWKFHWCLQAVSCLIGMIAVFICLPSQKDWVVYIWVAFQALWMFLRMFIYSWLESSGPRSAMMTGQSWGVSSLATRRRAIQLVFTLANQQVTIHPRGVYSYQDDLLTISALIKLWHDAQWSLDYLPVDSAICFAKSSDGPQDYLFIQVLGVVGDTLLRSASWLKGLALSNAELYDSALIFVKVANSSHIYCVPCARVLHRVSPATGDTETVGGMFEARGVSNTGPTSVSWKYWIPLKLPSSENHSVPASGSKINQSARWAEIGGIRVTGKTHEALIRNWDGLHNHLQGGVLNIGLSQVEEVAGIIRTARKATKGLRELLRSAQAD